MMKVGSRPWTTNIYPSDAGIVMNMDTCSENVLKTTQKSSRKEKKLKMWMTLPKFQEKKNGKEKPRPGGK